LWLQWEARIVQRKRKKCLNKKRHIGL
jgi:hypothetical protein